MAADRFMLGFPRLSIVLAVAGVLLLTASSAQGQSYQGPEATQDRPANGPTHTSQLPDWAEPSPLSSKSSSGKNERMSNNGDFRTSAAPPPPPQEQVPVDGGVVFLAAAGAGYAVRKLNEDEDEDDEPA